MASVSKKKKQFTSTQLDPDDYEWVSRFAYKWFQNNKSEALRWIIKEARKRYDKA